MRYVLIQSYTLFVSTPLTVLAFTFLILTIFTKKDDIAYKQFVFLCAVIAGWNIFEVLFFSVTDIRMADFFHKARFLFVPYLSVAMFMYSCKFSGFEKVLSLKYVICMLIFPTATVIINFTNDFHNLFRTQFEVLQAAPITLYINERGPWFWAHTGYSYAFIAAAFAVLVYRLFRVIKASKMRYYMMMFGSSFAILANVYNLFFSVEVPIDVTLWGITFGLIFQYFAMDTTPSSTFMLARNQSFDSLSDYAFIVNDKNAITDINLPAKTWLKQHGVTSAPLSLEALFSELKKKGATIERCENSGYWELYFADEESLLLSSYTAKSNFLYSKKNVIIGAIWTFSDMTAFRKTFRELQSQSTIDELTGTYNRRGYEKTIAEYDDINRLPLCVIIGDVNGLKRINDTLGHSAGDHILGIMALSLVECTADKGVVARIGGDEFAIVIAECDAAGAENLIAKIREIIAEKKDSLHGASIALGYAIKTSPEQDLARIVKEADQNMYLDKRNDRRQR